MKSANIGVGACCYLSVKRWFVWANDRQSWPDDA